MGPDGTLGPSESLDSDQVRNDDGDIVVDAPLRWIAPEVHLTLDTRLAAEEAEVGYDEVAKVDEDEGAKVGYGGRLLPRTGLHRGQISGSPYDGPSFYLVAREEFDQDGEDGA